MKRCFIALAVSMAAIGTGLAQTTADGFPTTKEQTTIVFTGDILLDRGVRKQIQWGSRPIIPDETVRLLQSADVVVGNLECPATKLKHPVFKRFVFRAEPEWLQLLKTAGFTHLNLANNHSLDQDRPGLVDTWRNIKAAGMVPVGAGENMRSASQPVLLGETPRKVYLVASNRLPLENMTWNTEKPCVSQESFDSLLTRVHRLKEADSTCVVVVSLHWGIEHTLEPTPTQRVQARQLIDAGADALVCHHTHTLQTIETYRGKSIYYSIGNFIFDQTAPLNKRACLVRMTVGRDKINVEAIPTGL